MPMRWGKKLVGSQPASTTRSPPRADTPRRPYKTRPFSCEPPIYLWLNYRAYAPAKAAVKFAAAMERLFCNAASGGRNLVLRSYGNSYGNVIDHAARDRYSIT